MTRRALIFVATAIAVVSAQFEQQLAEDTAQVQVLLDEIKTEGIKKFGVFSDYNPVKAKELINKATYNDGTEASVNRPVLDYLFENDIVLTVPQAQFILDEIKTSPGQTRKPRQAQPGERYYWKNRHVSYQFKFNDSTWQRLIRAALDHLEAETCMRFEENGTDPDRLSYTRAGGCWSNVGRIGGTQTVSIGYGCDSLGIIAHETLHALGLWHEQSRYDRDDYVDIDFGFIFPGTQSNFVKRTTKNSENYGQRYDLGSVMHYGAKAFATDYGRNTIVTKDENYQYTIGQRHAVSFKDARIINLRYCDDVCAVKLDCQHGGYTHPNDCSRCKCPSGLAGRLCDQVPPSTHSVCNAGDHVAVSSWQHLKGPELLTGMNCFYRIRAPAGQAVELEMLDSVFPCRDACSSYVEVKYLADKTTTGARLCCKVPTKTIVSEDDFVLLLLKAEGEMPKGYLGFNLRFRAVGRSVTPSVVPTTTTTTTAATTTTGTGSPEWSDWGAWGSCSQKCGGCGQRTRVRACYGGNGVCEGSSMKVEYCGQQPCPVKRPVARTTRCTGRLVLPCDLMDELDFGTTTASRNPSDAFGIELLQTKKNADTLKRVRREAVDRQRRFVDGNKQMADGNFCEKRFTYNCPTSLLTINVDRKTNRDVIVQDSTSCCPGWYKNQGVCVQGRNARNG